MFSQVLTDGNLQHPLASMEVHSFSMAEKLTHCLLDVFNALGRSREAEIKDIGCERYVSVVNKPMKCVNVQ